MISPIRLQNGRIWIVRFCLCIIESFIGQTLHVKNTSVSVGMCTYHLGKIFLTNQEGVFILGMTEIPWYTPKLDDFSPKGFKQVISVLS